MNTRRLIPLLAAGALALSAAPAGAATTLDGLVGPGFNISVMKGGKKVTTLKAGSYTFKVVDKTNAHNFVLNGPGVADKERVRARRRTLPRAVVVCAAACVLL